MLIDGRSGERVLDVVDVADLRRNRGDRARQEALVAGGESGWPDAIDGANCGTLLGAAQHADEAPDGMVVHRRALPRTPDEAHHRKPLQRVAIQAGIGGIAPGRARRIRAAASHPARPARATRPRHVRGSRSRPRRCRTTVSNRTRNRRKRSTPSAMASSAFCSKRIIPCWKAGEMTNMRKQITSVVAGFC